MSHGGAADDREASERRSPPPPPPYSPPPSPPPPPPPPHPPPQFINGYPAAGTRRSKSVPNPDSSELNQTAIYVEAPGVCAGIFAVPRLWSKPGMWSEHRAKAPPPVKRRTSAPPREKRPTHQHMLYWPKLKAPPPMPPLGFDDWCGQAGPSMGSQRLPLYSMSGDQLELPDPSSPAGQPTSPTKLYLDVDMQHSVDDVRFALNRMGRGIELAQIQTNEDVITPILCRASKKTGLPVVVMEPKWPPPGPPPPPDAAQMQQQPQDFL